MNFMCHAVHYVMQLPRNSLKNMEEGIFTVIHSYITMIFLLFTDIFSNIRLTHSKPNLNHCYRSWD